MSNQQLTTQPTETPVAVDDWKPVVLAGIDAYNRNMVLEEKKLEVAKMQSEQNYELHNKSMELEKVSRNRNFILRMGAIVMLGGTALYLILSNVNVTAGVTLLGSVALLASDPKFTTREK